MRDLKEINEWSRKRLYDIAKQNLSTMLYSCLIGINEAEKEAWKLYKNEGNDPDFNHWHRVAALRVLIDINKSKFKKGGSSGLPIVNTNGELLGIAQRVLSAEVLKSSSGLQTENKETEFAKVGITYGLLNHHFLEMLRGVRFF
jgi:hypothetical protein